MKQVIRCKYCNQLLMEIDKTDILKTNIIIEVDLIKKCDRCTKNRGEPVLRRFCITEFLKSTEEIIKV